MISQRKTSELLRTVGNTPLVRLDRITGGKYTIYAKMESHNPGGSVKDRPGLNMVIEGLKSGQLREGMRILDATSGNTGIAYGWVGAALGIGVTLCIPKNASPERFAILNAFGVDVIKTDPLEATDGAQKAAREIYSADPEKWFYPDQYGNDNNWRSHFETTGPEIWRQSEGQITHFCSVIGTSGTYVGVGRFLKKAAPHVKIVEIQPDSPFHGLEGIKHLPSVNVPAIYDETVKDETIEVSTEDAQQMCLRLAREEGMLVGPSSGANVVVASRIGERAGKSAAVATILCDDGTRYLHDDFWMEGRK
ncbi:MAG: cysteine synthase family protein [Candidatus Hydrogenedentota bacterium]